MIIPIEMPTKISYLYSCKCGNCYGKFECTADEFNTSTINLLPSDRVSYEDVDFIYVRCPFCGQMISQDSNPYYMDRVRIRDKRSFYPHSSCTKLDYNKSLIYHSNVLNTNNIKESIKYFNEDTL